MTVSKEDEGEERREKQDEEQGKEGEEKREKARATTDWSYKGMKVLILENASTKVSILLDKGTDIFELIYKPLDLDVIWHSPKGYRNPRDLNQNFTNQEDAFTDYYGGGWNDIFPNYGFPCSNRRVKFGLHGESSLLPWALKGIERYDGGVRAKVSFDCLRYPLHAEKLISLKDDSNASLSISEDITNIGEQEVELAWAQHIAFGEPFVGEDLRIDVPAIRARTHNYNMAQERVVRDTVFEWPLAPGLDGGKVDVSKIPERTKRVQEDFAITELREPWYKLYNPKLDLGVQVNWNRETFPYLWYWLNWGVLDYPWFGRGRTLALEPTTRSDGGGLEHQVRDGTAIVLQQGESVHGEIVLKFFQAV